MLRPRLPVAKIEMKGDTITVWSEIDKRNYKVSVRLIRKRVSKFKYDDNETIFDIVDEVVEYYKRSVLKHALLWLETRALEPLPRDDDKDAVTRVHEYIDLYWLAHKHDVRSLQNQIIDSFRARKICKQGYFARKLIWRVYENTVATSKLRKYLVDLFIFKSHFWKHGERENWMSSHEQYGEENAEFVSDVKTAIRKIKGVPMDPNSKSKCAYHYHTRGKRCV